jgi:glyoxylase-like metal-dependent hydrolase (beta-lactamase superfamily II)
MPGVPMLIDTGYTQHTLEGRGAALRAYAKVLAPRLNPEAQPEVFLAKFGLRPSAIATVVVTHFHADHVSGLTLFSKARLLASGRAWQAVRRRSALGNQRHGIFPELLPSDFEDRLAAIETRPEAWVESLPVPARDLLGDGSLLSVDLPGHAEGHFGLLFPKRDRPLLYAVDVQWRMAALARPRRPGFPSSLIAADRVALDRSADLVQGFAEAGGEVVLCHDPAPGPYDWQDPRQHVPLA